MDKFIFIDEGNIKAIFVGLDYFDK